LGKTFSFLSPLFVISPPAFHILVAPFFMAFFLDFFGFLPVFFIVQSGVGSPGDPAQL
jgi:hypothetical protein